MSSSLISSTLGPRGILTISMNSPKVNAMSGAFCNALADAFNKANSSPEVKGILFNSQQKAFSAGLDLKEVHRICTSGDRATVKAFLEGSLSNAIKGIAQCRKPVAAAVEGHAIAGGFILAAAADYTALGTGDYKIGLTELRVGVPFPALPYHLCGRVLTPKALRHFVYTANLESPVDAHVKYGFGESLSANPTENATEWLHLVTSRPLAAFSIAKQAFWQDVLSYQPPAEESEHLLNTIMSKECTAAMAATLTMR